MTYPFEVDGDLVWNESLRENEENYVIILTREEIVEVEAALDHFKKLGLDSNAVSQGCFPLPVLKHRLQQWTKDLHDGKGFLVLRGLEATKHSVEDNVIVFLGVSSYIAEIRGKQDHKGNMLMHLRNSKAMEAPQQARPARDSNTSLQFHTDLWTNVLAMKVLSNAAHGGRHILSPGYKVYNELSVTRPELLDLLMQPIWTFDRNSLHHTKEERPLIYWHEGRIIFNFGRLHVLGDVDMPNLNLSKDKLEAFEALQTLAEKHQLHLDSVPGDLVFVNNLAVLHCREAFEDTDKQSRHLVRMWLKNEALAWKLPPSLERGNNAVFYNDQDDGKWEILPQQRLHFELRDKFSP